MERLQRPAVPDQPLRQVIEQRGVAGAVAGLPEVARRADDPLAEMMLPQPVHDHSRRERIVGCGDGFGQFPSAAAIGERRRISAGQHLQEPPRRFVAKVLRVPADVDAQVLRLRDVLDGTQVGVRLRDRLVEARDFLLLRGDKRSPALGEEAFELLALVIENPVHVRDLPVEGPAGFPLGQ